MHHEEFSDWSFFSMGFGHGFIGILFWLIVIIVFAFILKDIFRNK